MAKHKDVLEAERRIKWAIVASHNTLDLSTLKGLKSFSELDTEITNATSVRHLILDHTLISDITPISEMHGITRLDLKNVPIDSLMPLSRMKALRSIDICGTQITSLKPLAKMADIEYLDLENTLITDFSPLTNCIKLTDLYLENTSFDDLRILRPQMKFESLDLANSRVTNLRPLLDLTFEGIFDKHSLRVTNTPAALADPRIAEIDAMKNHDTRVKELLEYLATLPADPTPRLKDIEGLLRGPILSDTLTDVTKPQSQFEATSLSDHPDKTPDEKFSDIVGTLQFAARKLGATDVQNRLGKDVAQSFREYTTFVTQDPLNPRILRFLGDSIQGAIINEDTAAALDAFDIPLFENFMHEHDALLSGYFNQSLAPVVFDVETDPDKLIKDLFPQLEAARKMLADADAAGLFAPSVSDALEMLHRRAEGARKKIITTGNDTDREVAVADLRRASVLTTSFLGRIKGRLTQWVEKQAVFAKENPGTTVLATDGLYGVATKVIEQVTPIFDALWKLIGNLPLPF